MFTCTLQYDGAVWVFNNFGTALACADQTWSRYGKRTIAQLDADTIEIHYGEHKVVVARSNAVITTPQKLSY